MALDRFITNCDCRSKPKDVKIVLEDYFMGIATDVSFLDDRFYVSLPGKPTHPLGRILSSIPDEPQPTRWIEVCLKPDLDVITRQQDEITCAIAEGLARLLARWTGGTYEND